MDYDKKHIISALGDLPQKNPPYDISGKVMGRIREQSSKRKKGLFGFIKTPFTFRFTPAQLLAGCSLGAVFFCAGILFHAFVITPREVIHYPLVQAEQVAAVHFGIGRELLSQGRPEDALFFIGKASQLSSAPEYQFWRGMTYYKLGDLKMERKSYLDCLAVAPDYLPALLNLGNSYLQTGYYSQALPLYRQVVEIDAKERQALHNLALIYRQLGEREQEKSALYSFLSLYRTGQHAGKAYVRLRALGNTDFQVYRLGGFQVIINQRLLLTGSQKDKQIEAEYIASVLDQLPPLQVHIVLLDPDDLGFARERAMELKNRLVVNMNSGHGHQLTSSWFRQEEFIQAKKGSKKQADSVLLFTTPIPNKNKGRTV